jgi:hypothetical protein
MKNKEELISQISDKIIEVCNLYNEVTFSDLQGLAIAKAMDIINLVMEAKKWKM